MSARRATPPEIRPIENPAVARILLDEVGICDTEASQCTKIIQIVSMRTTRRAFAPEKVLYFLWTEKLSEAKGPGASSRGFSFGADVRSGPEGANQTYSVADLHSDFPDHRLGGTIYVSPQRLRRGWSIRRSRNARPAGWPFLPDGTYKSVSTYSPRRIRFEANLRFRYTAGTLLGKMMDKYPLTYGTLSP